MNRRRVRIEERVSVGAVPPGASELDLWYPVIADDSRQQVLDLAFDRELPLTFGYDPEHGNRLVHLHLDKPLPGNLEFTASYMVETADDAAPTPVGEALGGGDEARLRHAAQVLAAARRAPRGADRAGQVVRQCRAAGLTARPVAGLRATAPGVDGRLQPHLWMEVFIPRRGWLPADPSEGGGAELGRLGLDRLARCRGEDILLHPMQQGPRVPALMGPYSEIDGRPHLAEAAATAWTAEAAATDAQQTADVALDAAADLAVALPAQDGVAAILASLVPAPRRVRLARGATYYQTDPGEEWLLLLTAGRVRLSRFTLGGKKLELDVLQAPAFFVGARLGKGVAEALSEAEMQVMSREQARELVRRRPDLGFRLLEGVGERLVDNEDRLEYLAYHGVPERVALALLRLRCAETGMIDGITHQELGDMVGSYRETVTKVLGGFQQAGYIELSHRRIRVRNPAGLAEILEG